MAGGSKRKASRRRPERRPDTAAGKGHAAVYGKEFLASLDDDREVWIYGERVKNITTHPAFQNTAGCSRDSTTRCTRTTERQERPHHAHRVGRLHAPLLPGAHQRGGAGGGARCHRGWARLTYGWLGRSPDYKAAFLGTLGANADFYAPYQANATRWYRYRRSACPSSTTPSSIRRSIAISRRARRRGHRRVRRVSKETDAGIYVTGPRWWPPARRSRTSPSSRTTGSSRAGQELRHRVHGADQRQGREAHLPRVQRDAGGDAGSPFDYPLSSRLDENDAIFVMDKVFVPWEDVFVYGDVEKANNFFPRTGFLPRALIHGCTGSR
jgi:4-hydroxyphenylacetate 3-monooxygenase